MMNTNHSLTNTSGEVGWARPKKPRCQADLFGTALDTSLPEDCEIRALDALLNELDWAPWEALYKRQMGQPPIHPRLVAGTILYCLMEGILSSRQIEKQTRLRIDLMWFLEGRTLDHSTLCAFRIKFEALLPGLFDAVALKAASGPQAGETLASDGTSMRANSDRHGARQAASLKRRLGKVAAESEALLSKMAQIELFENCEDALDSENHTELQKQIKALESEKTKLEKAMAQAEKRDALKQAVYGKNVTAVRVPVTDPDAYLLPNKDGGYAPNYTPTLTVDVASGAIVDAQVPHGSDEAGTIPQAIKATERRLARKADALLCDGNFTSAATLKHLEETQVALYSPVASPLADAAKRKDPTKPVSPEQLDNLPTSGKGASESFTRAAFVYDPEQDIYYCPQGQRLEKFSEETRHDRQGNAIVRWRYKTTACSSCPLRTRCTKNNAQSRSVARDEHQPYRDRQAAHMETAASKELYKKRAPVVEGAFGHIKHNMKMRQFLRRGRAAVLNEWQWICTAFNIGKLLRKRPTATRNTPKTTVFSRILTYFRHLLRFSQNRNHNSESKALLLHKRASRVT